MPPSEDPLQSGIDYAENVVAGKIPAPRYVKLACKRFVRDLALAESGRGSWAFDADLALFPFLCCEGLPNIKGPFAGQDIV